MQAVSVTVFDTLTLIVEDVVVFPAASRARAESVCVPLAVLPVFQEILNGEEVSSLPKFVPSSRN